MRLTASGAWVHLTACVEGVVGAGTVVGAFAWVGPLATVGRDCVIGPGCRIGQDGFGYTLEPDGSWKCKPQSYGVLIEDDVHLGANVCIDRGSYRDTTIRSGTRIDNLVHLSHNCVVGRNVMIVAHAMIAGSVEIGDGAWVGPSASILQHVVIGARALVGMGSVVLHDVEYDVTVAGIPARVVNDEVGVREAM